MNPLEFTDEEFDKFSMFAEYSHILKARYAAIFYIVEDGATERIEQFKFDGEKDKVLLTVKRKDVEEVDFQDVRMNVLESCVRKEIIKLKRGENYAKFFKSIINELRRLDQQSEESFLFLSFW